MLCFAPSLAVHDPKKRLKAVKCNQNIRRKLSVANIVYKLSKLKYKLKIPKKDSSCNEAWKIVYKYALAKIRGNIIELVKILVNFEFGIKINNNQNGKTPIFIHK